MDKALKQETKETLIKYAVCFGIEALIAFLVIWSKGFFTQRAEVNIQILSDAFFVSGILMTLFAGLLYVSSEGALIGISFVLRNIVLAFVPMGRAKHERYADYRERKLSKAKKQDNKCILITGLFFLTIGIVFTIIWYAKFYNV